MVEDVAASNPTKVSLNHGRKRRWAEQEHNVLRHLFWLRELGVGITANMLFELMSEEEEGFAGLSFEAKWNWYRRFTSLHGLAMSRPNRITCLSRGEEDSRCAQFIREVELAMEEHQVCLAAKHRFKQRTS